MPFFFCIAGATVIGPSFWRPAFAQALSQGEYERLGMPVIGETLQQRFEHRQPPIGARVGAFWIKPELALDEELNDNVFATPSATRADAITTLAGRTAVEYRARQIEARFDGALTGHKYAINTTENEWEALGRLNVAAVLRHDLQLAFGSQVERLILPRTDPTGIGGVRPTTYQQYDAHTEAVVGDPLRNQLHARIGANRLSYDPLVGFNSQLGFFPINTTERNRVEFYGDFHFDHRAFDQQRLFAEIRPNDRTYDLSHDTGGFQRSSRGVRAGVGAVIDRGPLVFSLEGGFQVQNYDDRQFGTITEPLIDLKASWWPTLLTNLRLSFKHEYEEEFFVNSPGAVRNLIEAQIDHELRRRMIASLIFRTDLRDTVTVSQFVEIEEVEAKLQYQFAEGFSAGVSYLFSHQRGTIPRITGIPTPNPSSNNYDQNVLRFTVQKLF